MDAAFARAVSQLHHGAEHKMSATSSIKRRIKLSAFGLMTLALAFYFGFIALLVFRSRH
jgi:hypothetical protein